MRLFIGVRIPEEIRKNIEQVYKELKKIREAKPVALGNLHITLKFIGEVEEKKREEIEKILEKIKQGFKKFEIEVKGIGTFPEGKKIRVLWIGADSKGILKNLNKRIEEELEKIGIEKENRFKEHITIARFKATPDLKTIEYIKEKYSDKNFGNFVNDRFELIESKLSSEGPTYITLSTYYL